MGFQAYFSKFLRTVILDFQAESLVYQSPY